MKAATSQMISLLGNAQALYRANLITFTLADGTTLNYTDADQDIIYSGTTYSSKGPYPLIGTMEQRLGLEVDTTKVGLYSLLTNVVESTAVLAAIAEGKFDNAQVWIQRLYMPIFGNTSAGSVQLFYGNVSDISDLDRFHAELEIKDRKQVMNVPMPFNVYQPGCRWPLYGAGCTLNKTSFAVSGTVTAGSVPLLLNTSLTNVSGYFDEGTVQFTSGANSGLEVAIRQYLNAGGQILLFLPLPSAPLTGDAFKAYPGCDHTSSTCTNKFNNLINFGGFEFIPVAESAV